MPRYWWVNHRQTARQEIGGQYLWSPKTESNGARSQFYDNMRRAIPGDLVLSFADGWIRYIGRVTDFAMTAPKPEEFGTVGSNWSHEGWLLPVYWTPLAQPVRPKAMIAELGPLLPDRYSPLHPITGNGNQKAYLAEVDAAVFDAVLRQSPYNPALLQARVANSLSFEIVNDVLEDVVERRIASDLTMVDTERKAMIAARRGQGRFRSNVESVEFACRLTGITNPALLIASHIKPWRLCKTGRERLDGMNGLLLTPDADHLFDRGFISFADEGDVMVSPRVEREDLRRLGFARLCMDRFSVEEAPAVWNTSVFRPEQKAYLAFHRAEVFVK